MKAAIKLVAGNSNRALAEAIAAYLELPLGQCTVRRFADMEIFVEIQENVRGQDVFIVQSTSFPTNDHLMELLIIIDAMRRSSARRITAVIPYFGYARQDRRASGRTPISAKLVSNLITHAGADRVLTLDLHAGQIQGFFDIPTDNLFSAPLMAADIKKRINNGNLMVVSPDVGGVVRARALAKRIDAPLAIVDKRRERPGESEVMNIIGDVTGRSCILVDDIVDSVQCGRSLAGKRRQGSVRLYHPRGALWRGCGTDCLFQAQGTGDHGFDSADGSRQGGAQYPRDLDCRFAGRSHWPNGARTERFKPFRLTTPYFLAALRSGKPIADQRKPSGALTFSRRSFISPRSFFLVIRVNRMDRVLLSFLSF